MPDTIIQTTNRPHRCLYRHGGVEKAMPMQNSVRAFRVDPECVQLQLRMKSDYVIVALTPDETHRLIDALLDALPKGT